MTAVELATKNAVSLVHQQALAAAQAEGEGDAAVLARLRTPEGAQMTWASLPQSEQLPKVQASLNKVGVRDRKQRNQAERRRPARAVQTMAEYLTSPSLSLSVSLSLSQHVHVVL